jgi:hypothetical protein
MRVIIMSNDPRAVDVYKTACTEQALCVLDFRMQQPGFGHRNGLHYSLGHRYGLYHHSQMITMTLKRILRWSRAEMPMIVIVEGPACAASLRAAIRADYPLTQIVEGAPVEA